jgi:acetoacetate decarboxylase
MATTTADTPGVALGLKGKVTKNSFGDASCVPLYAPTYPMFGAKDVWKWLDCDIILIDYTTDAAAAAEFLPAECNLVDIPIAPGQSAMKLVWANYRGGTLPPYYEVIQSIPCVYKGELYLYVYQIWVNTDSAMTSGREMGGYPKKLADIGLDRFGDTWTGYLDRSQEKPIGSRNRIASFSFKETGKMVSLPLPADRKPTFPFPYNLCLPLPEATGKPQPLPFKTMCMRLIMNAQWELDKRPKWALAQLCHSTWTLEKGTLWAGDATVAFQPSDHDPLDKLPINMVLDAMLFKGDMYLPKLGVLEDL